MLSIASSVRCCVHRRAWLFAPRAVCMRRRTSYHTSEFSNNVNARPYPSATSSLQQQSDGNKSPETKIAAAPEGIDWLRSGIELAIAAILRQKKDHHQSLEKLAHLNGYARVRIDETHRRVQLAEGVIAEAKEELNSKVTIFARETRRRSRSKEEEQNHNRTKAKDRHPSFLDEDFTWYRVLEKQIEESFDRQEDAMRKWYEGKVTRAQKAVDRVYTPVSQLVTRRRSAGIAENNVEAREEGGGGDDETVKYCAAAPSTSTDDDPNTDAKTIVNEDILILSNRHGHVLLVEDVPPEYRLLVLPETSSFRPYKLRHGRSGIVIYSGLVLFGAVPVAYRSLKYAMDYPGLAKAMVASVVASVSYSLWASWYNARTRQSLVVRSAVASRIVARDEAAYGQLFDGACRVLSDAVMNEYLSRLDLGGKRKDGAGKVTSSPLELTMDGSYTDPTKIALGLGLLKLKLKERASSRDLVAVDMTTVSSELGRHLWVWPSRSR